MQFPRYGTVTLSPRFLNWTLLSENYPVLRQPFTSSLSMSQHQ